MSAFPEANSTSSAAVNMSVSDTNAFCTTSTVSEINRMPSFSSFSAPAETSVSVSRVDSPSVFTQWYPVLKLPSPGGSPGYRSPARSPARSPVRSPARSPARLPCRGSPRHLSMSPRLRQPMGSKTSLRAQPLIDKVFQSLSKCAVSSPQSSIVPPQEQDFVSELQSLSVSPPKKKKARPSEISVSPLLSRNRENFVRTIASNDLQSSDVRAARFNEPENICSMADVGRDKSSGDAVTSSGDVIPETSIVENTETAVAGTRLQSFQVDSAGAGFADRTVSQASADKKIAAGKCPLKFSATKLQKMRQILSNKYAEVCTTSGVSPSLSLPTVGSRMTSAMTNCESGFACTTSKVCDTAVFSRNPLPAADGISDSETYQHLDRVCIDQHVASVAGVNYDNSKVSSVPAMKTVASHGRSNGINSCASGNKLIYTYAQEGQNISHLHQHLDPDRNEKDSTVNHVDTVSNEIEPNFATGQANGSDSQDALQEFNEFPYAPVESKPFFSRSQLHNSGVPYRLYLFTVMAGCTKMSASIAFLQTQTCRTVVQPLFTPTLVRY